MTGDLSHHSDDDLLNMVMHILAKPGGLTTWHRTELDQIADEFARRDMLQTSAIVALNALEVGDDSYKRE